MVERSKHRAKKAKITAMEAATVTTAIPEEGSLAAAGDFDDAKLIALTKEEESLVNEELQKKSKSNSEKVAVLDGNSVNRESLLRLLPKEWLNDEIINFFFRFLNVRDRLKCKVAKGNPKRR